MLHPVDGHPELVWDDEKPVDFKPNIDKPDKVVFKTKLKDGAKTIPEPNNNDETIEVNIPFDEWKKLTESQEKKKLNEKIIRT